MWLARSIATLWAHNSRGAQNQPGGADQPAEERLILAIPPVERQGEAVRPEPGGPSREQQRHARGEVGVTGKNYCQVLLLQLDGRQIDQREQDRKQERQPHAAGRGRKSEGRDQSSEVKGIARERIGSRRRKT